MHLILRLLFPPPKSAGVAPSETPAKSGAMSTIAPNDRRTPQYVATAGQTDFAVDFPILKYAGSYAGVFAEKVHGTTKTTLSLDDFDLVDVTGAGATARLRAGATAGDKFTFYGRHPGGRDREHIGAVVRTDILEADQQQDVAVAQELRRDVDALLAATPGAGLGDSPGGVSSWAELSGIPAALSALALLTGTANAVPMFTDGDSMGLLTVSAYSQGLLGLTSKADWKAALEIGAGGVSVTWSDITGKPAFGALATGDFVDNSDWNGVALSIGNGGTGASSAAQARTNLGLTIGTQVQAYNANLAAMAGVTTASGKVWEWTGPGAGHLIDTPSGGGGGGTTNYQNFVVNFSGNGDGTTNNDAAFTAAEASSYERIFLPDGVYVTTKTRDTLTKRYVGPGRIKTSATRWLQNFGAYRANTPYLGITEYGQDSASSQFSDMEYYNLLPDLRVGLTERYYYAPAVPKFAEYRHGGGWSGIDGVTSAAMTTGSTSVTIRGGVAGWTPGRLVGFVDPVSGNITDTKTIATVGGGGITWVGGLSQAYPAGTVITRGQRTSGSYQLAIVDHAGAGDCYVWWGRIIGSYTPLASQDLFQFTSTVGLIGGDMTLTKDGIYGTGWEMQYIDQGKDVCIAGSVNSYIRTNNTAARDVFWMHDYAKSEIIDPTIKPIDGVWVAAIKANVGLDLTRSSFTVGGSFNNAAIALSDKQKIYFNASTSYPGTGNGWTANVMGGSYVHHDFDGTSDFMEMWCGAYRARIRSNGSLNFNGSINAGSNLSATTYVDAGSYLNAATYVSAGSSVNAGTYVSAGSFVVATTYLSAGSYVDAVTHVNAGSELRVGGTKVVGSRAGTIPDATYGTEAGTINSILSVMRTHGLIST